VSDSDHKLFELLFGILFKNSSGTFNLSIKIQTTVLPPPNFSSPLGTILSLVGSLSPAATPTTSKVRTEYAVWVKIIRIRTCMQNQNIPLRGEGKMKTETNGEESSKIAYSMNIAITSHVICDIYKY
jgi:hypothetical protein